jgi:hypothetical protein
LRGVGFGGASLGMLSFVGELIIANLDLCLHTRYSATFGNAEGILIDYTKVRLRYFSGFRIPLSLSEAEISPGNRRASDRVGAFSPPTRLVDGNFYPYFIMNSQHCVKVCRYLSMYILHFTSGTKLRAGLE